MRCELCGVVWIGRVCDRHDNVCNTILIKY